MKKFIAIIIIIHANLLFAQKSITHLTEMQRIFFVSEVSGLASASYNPAGMTMRADNNGIILGYDFDEFKKQGNSSVFLITNNLGIAYQDIYNVNNVRLQNYSINLSIGNEYISFGTSNRYTIAKYPHYDLKLFSLDAGLIIKPAKFLSIGILARNLNEVKFDSLNYTRNHTAGIGLIFLNETFRIYADGDFKDNTKIDDVVGTIGLVVTPLNIFEFRGGVVLNPDDLVNLNYSLDTLNLGIKIDLKYEAFLSVSFLIKNTIRVTAATRFNDKGERTRISAVLGFPLSKLR